MKEINVYLLIAIVNNEELIEDLITGWIDIGVTGATVLESTGMLQFISNQIPIFAGFRGISGGAHNQTILSAIDNPDTLDQAISYLEALCRKTGKAQQGVYFVAPLSCFGKLGAAQTENRH